MGRAQTRTWHSRQARAPAPPGRWWRADRTACRCPHPPHLRSCRQGRGWSRHLSCDPCRWTESPTGGTPRRVACSPLATRPTAQIRMQGERRIPPMSFLRRVFGSRPAAREVFARGPHAQLMRECERTSEEVIAYLEARARKEPSPEPRTPNNDAWHEAQNNYARYMMDTMTEYRKRFESRLAGVRDALAALA